MGPLLQFECLPPTGGYRIALFDERKFAEAPMQKDYSLVMPDDATEDERFLAGKWGIRIQPGPGEVPALRRYLLPLSTETAPFDLYETAPGLFLDFAHTPATADDILRFADRSGPLHREAYAETTDSWTHAIRQMKKAVSAWDRARATGKYDKVVQLVSERAAAHVFADDPEGVGAYVSLAAMAGRGARLVLKPADLLDALWIQFALAVDGNQSLRSCIECGKWFPIEFEGVRTDKQYCSDACRMRAYRKRKVAKAVAKPRKPKRS